MDPNVGNESPPPRTTILGSFLRGRPRNSSQSHINTDIRELSPSPPQPPSPNAIVGGHRRNRVQPPPVTTTVQPSTSHQPTPTSTVAGGLGLSHMLRRRRSAGTIASPAVAAVPAMPASSTTTATPVAVSTSAPAPPPRPTTTTSSAPGHRIRLVPHLDSRRSLRFEAIGRDLREGDPALRIGRFTDRSGLGLAAVNAMGSNKLAFKSKVVSRAHAEIWVESGGRFFIKDTKSSSGTFLNHTRLSPANTESRPFQMKDGDILQLGVDYQGGAEDIYKSVKIKIEVGREWQSAANPFNTNALKNLKTLAVGLSKSANGTAALKPGANGTSKSQIPDCCICLFGVTIRQALFIAPCSHTFHYKCIRPLLETHHPAFSCPLCRTFADLEEDVEIDVEDFCDDDEVESAVEGDDAAAAVAARGSRPTSVVVPGGAETEVEGTATPPPGVPGAAPRVGRMPMRSRLSMHGGAGDEIVLAGLQEEQGDSDEVMLDVEGVGARDGGDTSGSGEGDGGDNSPVPVPIGEMAEVDDDGIEVDGTVGPGGKRKR